MKKTWLGAVVALIAIQGLSGCWILRESNWTKDKVEPGKSTTFKGNLVGVEGDPAYFFILPRLDNDDVSIRRPVFDPREVVGNRRKLVEDATLGQVAVETGEGCDVELARRQGPTPTRAYKTAVPVASPERKLTQVTFKAKVSEATTEVSATGVVFVGYWEDDGDGIPEGNDQDVINCSGFTSSAFLVKK